MAFETIAVYYFLFLMLPSMIIAKAKNKSVLNAFFGSLLFGIFALIYYIFARSEPPKQEKHTLKCTGCGAKVSDSDKYCPGCGAHFKEKGIECPKCKTHNKEEVKYCTKCGYKLIKEPEPEFICESCNKKFKSEEALEKHYEHCEAKKERAEKDTDISIWIVCTILYIGLGIYLLVNNKINLIPFILIGFIITPFFDKFFNWYKKKNNKLKHFKFNWWKKGILIVGIVLLFVLINLVIPECPATCNDNNSCSNDFCSTETGYKCMNTLKLNCNGNGICENGEYGTSDCPNCEDNNKCTADSYDIGAKKCINIEMKGCIK